MRSTLIGWIAVVAVTGLGIARPVRAQETNQVGVVMAYPSSVGLVWKASDRFAIRPDATFSVGSADSVTGGPSSTNDVRSYGAGVSALFYLKSSDGLHFYVTPRYGFSRLRNTTSVSSSVFETTTTTHLVTGSFGAQYLLGRRFALFGELGIGYSRATGSSSTSVPPPATQKSHAHLVSSRSGAGVIVYF